MAAKTEDSKQGNGLTSIIVAAVAVILLGLALGFFGSPFVVPVDAPKVASKEEVSNSSEHPSADAGHGADQNSDAESPDSKTGEENHGPPRIVRMQPIVTNLSDTTEVWVRLEGSLLVDSTLEENPDMLAAQLAQYVLAYLRSLKLSDLQGQGAINAIAQDLNEIASTMSEGKVQGVLISGLVFE